MKWGSWVNLIIGIWLLISPVVLHLAGIAMNNNIAFGILAIIVAIWSMVVMPQNHAPAWINLAFGIWVFISPWVLGFAAGYPALWNSVICGVLLVIFAIVRMSSTRLPASPGI
jgi:hypothetical protein